MSAVNGFTVSGRTSELLTQDAMAFLAALERQFGARRRELLKARTQRKGFDFLPETAAIRAAEWSVASIPAALMDRRVEITGPAEPKMIINALNSGANMFMVDFEDSLAPTWNNALTGQEALFKAVRHSLTFTSSEGKQYALNEKTAVLLVRPRGWHLIEKHLLIDNRPASGSLFDFGLYFFHNAKELLSRNSGPYFYLPKLESHLEARLWNDVFVLAQELLGVPQGSIRATVLIETILAAFEMDEILYELRDHSAGLNCGRWDYIFSCIKKFRNAGHLFPDRALVTMTTHFMRSYSLLAIKTCHRRNIHAVGGMSAFIPVKNDQDANERAFAQVRADKEREANDGHDGTWVAHPGLVPVALDVFDTVMPQPNQIDRKRDDVQVGAADLLQFADGPITEAGLRTNVSVGVQYVEAWLGGQGAVPINNLMEDAATAEISRAQVWQWIRHPEGRLPDGRKIDLPLVREVLAEELAKLRERYGDAAYVRHNFKDASALFDRLVADDQFVEFLTLPGYQMID